MDGFDELRQMSDIDFSVQIMVNQPTDPRENNNMLMDEIIEPQFEPIETFINPLNPDLQDGPNRDRIKKIEKIITNEKTQTLFKNHKDQIQIPSPKALKKEMKQKKRNTGIFEKGNYLSQNEPEIKPKPKPKPKSNSNSKYKSKSKSKSKSKKKANYKTKSKARNKNIISDQQQEKQISIGNLKVLSCYAKIIVQAKQEIYQSQVFEIIVKYKCPFNKQRMKRRFYDAINVLKMANAIYKRQYDSKLFSQQKFQSLTLDEKIKILNSRLRIENKKMSKSQKRQLINEQKVCDIQGIYKEINEGKQMMQELNINICQQPMIPHYQEDKYGQKQEQIIVKNRQFASKYIKKLAEQYLKKKQKLEKLKDQRNKIKLKIASLQWKQKDYDNEQDQYYMEEAQNQQIGILKERYLFTQEIRFPFIWIALQKQKNGINIKKIKQNTKTSVMITGNIRKVMGNSNGFTISLKLIQIRNKRLQQLKKAKQQKKNISKEKIKKMKIREKKMEEMEEREEMMEETMKKKVTKMNKKKKIQVQVQPIYQQ